MEHPEAIGKLVIAGVGEKYFHQHEATRFGIADALLARDPAQISDPTQKMFRAFASQPGKDIAALAACMRGDRHYFSHAELSGATLPALVICGEIDDVSGPPEPLAEAINGARAITVPGRDHMSAVGDKVTKFSTIDFLKG